MEVSTGRAIAYDVAVVLVFLVLGNAAHDSASAGGGHLVALAACFLVALAAGWGVARAWRAPTRIWPTGVVVWLVTAAIGVTLRGLLIADAGFAPTFVAVALGFLGLTQLGWRALATMPLRRP